jgi:putative redox protein
MKAIAHNTGPTFLTDISIGSHKLVADEPADQGGADTGPTATQILSAALGACTAATLRSYANLKGLPLEAVEVEVEFERRKPSEQVDGAKASIVRKKITLTGDLTQEQRERMLQIAEKCPVNRALKEGVDFE